MDVKTATSRLKMARVIAASEIAFSGRPVAERAVAGAGLRPDLNALLLTMPARQLVYLIDRGYRRWIENAETLHRLFGRDAHIVETEAAIEIPLGTSVYPDARLVRHARKIYLVDYEPDGTSLRNRPISPEALGWFRTARIENLDADRFNVLGAGTPFEGPQFGT